MSSSYKVLAPYVTLKVKDVNGQDVMLGYYRDGLVHNPVDGKHVGALLDLGMIEEAVVTKAPEAEVSADVEMQPFTERPAGNASQETWAKYAVESGQASEDEVKDLSRDDLRELYG